MAEYIEREAAIRNIRKMASMIGFENPAVAIDCAVKCLERVPAADVVPVVRCRYCKYHHWEQEPCHGNTVHICDLIRAEVDKDFFCAAGERAVQLDA